MKNLSDSRLFWCVVIAGGCTTITTGLAAAGAPAWVVVLVSGAGAAANAGALFLKVQDHRQAVAREG